MTNVEKALLVAERIHSRQSYDIFPYIYHIRRALKIAQELGYDEPVQVACCLHDSLEDTDLSYNDIKKYFGEEVAEIVFAITDELGRNRQEKKEKTYPKIKANYKAILVKLCDRIANVSHSKEYGHSMYKSYCKEGKEFYDNIGYGVYSYNPVSPKDNEIYDPKIYNEIQKGWDKLYLIMKE